LKIPFLQKLRIVRIGVEAYFHDHRWNLGVSIFTF